MSGCFVVAQILLLLMALVRGKSSGIVLPPPDNLARLTDLLHARNVVIFCPLWGPAHLKQIAHQLGRAIRLNPESAPFGKGPISLLTCPGQFLNKSQFLGVLNKQSEIVSTAPRIVLYQSESDLGILDSISEIPINHPIYLYNVDTMVLWELYSLSGVRYRNEVGSFDPGNGTALRLTMNALKGKTDVIVITTSERLTKC